MNMHVGLESVSYHAVTRFCQRILDVPLMAGFSNPRDETSAYCKAAGLSIVQVRAMILTEKVRLELLMGKAHSGNALFHAFFRNGTVATIYSAADAKLHIPKFKCQTKKQLRQGAQKHLRRFK